MRYQSTTGLAADQIEELVGRIEQIVECRQERLVSRVWRGVLPLIGEALCMHVPDLVEAIRGRLVLVDGTDVPTGNRAGQKVNFSGKRHRSGLNIQVTSDTQGTLVGISEPSPGSMHDRKAFAETGWEDRLDDADVVADPGYQGTVGTRCSLRSGSPALPR